MQVKTYRARTMQEALALVRRDLGPQAAVLHTRDVGGGLWRLLGGKRVEVTASNEVHVPSRLPARSQGIDLSRPEEVVAHLGARAAQSGKSHRQLRAEGTIHDRDAPHMKREGPQQLESLVDELCRRSRHSEIHDLPDSLFRLFTDLIEADVQ